MKKNNLNDLLEQEKTERLVNYQWQELRNQCLIRDDYKCVLCGKQGFECDHIIPVSLGGENNLKNLQTLCNKCHKEKTKKDINKLTKLNRVKKINNRKIPMW